MDMNDRIVVEGFPDYSAELEQWRGRAALHFSDHYAGFVEKNETARYLLKKHESWILHCTGPWGDTDFMALRCLIFPDMTKTCEEAPPHMSASVNLCSRDEAQRKRDELHRALPEAEYVVLDWGEDKAFIYSRAAYFLFLEFRPGLWQGLVHQFALYYGDLMPDMSDLGKSEPFERAMVLSLRAYDPAVRVNFAIRNVLPPGSILTLWNVIGFFFQSDLCEVLKVALWEVIGCPCVNLSTLDDREFTQRFVQEWEYLKCFSGIVHDFSVHPRFLDRDMIRYANLPPRRRREAIVNEMINYVALRICPTYYLTINHVHPGLFRRWANLLQEMMEPRVQGVVRQLEERAERGLASGEAEKLASEMRGDIIRWTALDYWPWYHRDTALKGRPFWYIQPFANWGSMVEIGKYPAKGEPKDTDATFPERHRLGWVRPSAFLRSRLRGKYLGDSRRRGEPLSPSLMEEERAEAAPSPLEKVAGDPDRGPEKGREAEAGGWERHDQGMPHERLIDGERCIAINHAAALLDVTPQTLRNWEGQQKVRIIWRKSGRGGGMRWVPEREVDRLRPMCVKDRTIAKTFGCPESHVKYLKGKHGLRSLPREEQVRRLYAILASERRPPGTVIGGQDDGQETEDAR